MRKRLTKICSTCVVMYAVTVIISLFVIIVPVYAVGQNTITVNGQGTVKAAPDIAYVNVGVQTENKDAKASQTENNMIMNKVLTAVKGIGITDADIKTSGYNVYPNYDYTNSTNKITGYIVNNQITITVKDINKVGEVLEVAIAAGSNTANNIRFDVADTSIYYGQALDLAIKNANTKVGFISQSLGVTVGKPSEIIEMNSYNSPIAYNGALMNKEDAGIPVQPGEIEISVTLQVTYQY